MLNVEYVFNLTRELKALFDYLITTRDSTFSDVTQTKRDTPLHENKIERCLMSHIL